MLPPEGDRVAFMSILEIMIDVGILGGTGTHTGELIRILINHPDVMLRQVCEPDLAGRDIKSQHHGLIGESSLKYVDRLEYGKLDVVFVTTSEARLRESLPTLDDAPELCVIDMADDFTHARSLDPLIVYGVPEVNRKPLVRGARRAVIPPAAESLACIAFLPLAMRCMLPRTVMVTVECASGLADAGKVNPAQVADVLRLSGNEPQPVVDMRFVPGMDSRAIRLSATLDLPMPIDNIVEMYEELYEDHNLTHVVGEAVDSKEVEGTDKCVVSLDKTPDGLLHVQAVADAGMRGGAGDAVHVMNLLMGLYEKTGLALKASNL